MSPRSGLAIGLNKGHALTIIEKSDKEKEKNIVAPSRRKGVSAAREGSRGTAACAACTLVGSRRRGKGWFEVQSTHKHRSVAGSLPRSTWASA